MHRRMSLGVCMMLIVMFLVAPVSAFAEPVGASEASAAGSLDLLSRAWEWLTSIVGADSAIPGGEHLNANDGGMFIDPNGNS